MAEPTEKILTCPDLPQWMWHDRWDVIKKAANRSYELCAEIKRLQTLKGQAWRYRYALLKRAQEVLKENPLPPHQHPPRDFPPKQP